MLDYGFFNSVNGTPSYNADDFNNFFAGILSDTGVYKKSGGAFEVTAGGGMSVNVATGRGRINNHWFSLTGTEILAIETANSNPRYDAIVIRHTKSNNTISLAVKKGTASSNPVRPTMLNDETAHEICLAYVYIPASAVEVTSIIDTRSDVALCGYVTMNIDAVNAGIRQYRNVITTTGEVSQLQIGIPEYDAENDLLFANINGIMFVESEDYVVNGTGSNAVIETANPIRANNIIEFRVIKSTIEVL